MLLPYREGKTASSVTAIGSPACTVNVVCDSFGFFCLKILKKTSTLAQAVKTGRLRREYWGTKEGSFWVPDSSGLCAGTAWWLGVLYRSEAAS